MDERVKSLSGRLADFNTEVIAFVENCTKEDWNKKCEWEDWTVGVVARHIGAGHYGSVELAKSIVNGQPLPDLSMEKVKGMANNHAVEHHDCTREEVLEILKSGGAKLCDYVEGLVDADLDKTGTMALFKGEVTTLKLLETIILDSAGSHLDNMRAAISG